jgi:hypothetical protein
MRVQFALFFICSAAFCQGCNLPCVATGCVSSRMTQCIDDFKERARNSRWAKTAWQDYVSADPEAHFSADYEAGFLDGFTDYLYRGGNGDPPPLPPKMYRRLRFQTPGGYRAIEEWFTGYRAGATVAQREGYRQLVTGPSALRVPGEHAQFSGPGP